MRGEIVFDVEGQRYTLFLGNAAQCAVEAQYDRGFFAVIADAMPDIDAQTAMAVAASMDGGAPLSPAIAEKAAAAVRGIRLSLLRDLAWHGLRKHHPLINLSQVSDIIDAMGRDAFGDVIGRAMRAAQGEATEVGDDAAPGKPVPQRKKPARQKRKPTGRA